MTQHKRWPLLSRVWEVRPKSPVSWIEMTTTIQVIGFLSVSMSSSNPSVVTNLFSS